ncbi:phosphorylase [Gregarina niphandrodes]|uniref:Alpha-1,4 glucan phosphorylase n=1 Tax=Gregarina niphandrodes TaxID=110365 RepID=A0A023B035_GRENI|nr:phosphorylase [Gregarina niphandrodes]EZG43928.1 phosphorylase [Gregarina niphandrodes]|eukprot:XP_011132899.1 phosphorylase [Gregarina niphandrodes]
MADPVFAPRRLNSAAFEMQRKSSFSKLDASQHTRVLAFDYSGDVSPGAFSEGQQKLWSLMHKHMSTDAATIQRQIVNHVEYTLARNRFNVDQESVYRATAYSIRDRLIELLNDTNQYFVTKDVKRCYYLSLEFLVGRAMQNALVNLDIEEQYRKALGDLGYKLEALYEYEHDAALGNGGLGRLAACFLDSMATTNYACWGYGIRYTYGIFEQKIVNGWQCEYPDYWLIQDNPWEVVRHDVTYAVRFGGHVKSYTDEKGRFRQKWVGGQIVQAVAYDNPIPGFDTFNCINLRLWKAAPSKEFDFDSFNAGKYMEAIKDRQDAESISSVLYPNDNMPEGKELRLKQQYFFVCATIQDVLRRFKKKENRDWRDLPKKVALQLNDTHPTIGIPELIRILVDVEGLEWDVAVDITRKVFAYTNHTVLPEALEKWSASLMARLLPRHILIINELNHRFLQDVRSVWGDDYSKISKMSIYEDGYEKLIRMANLAVIGGHRCNGVAVIHSDLVKRDLFPEFAEYFRLKGEPDYFTNVTNGVTPRRWLHNANRLLSNLISQWLGSDGWLKDLTMIKGLENHIEDPALIKEWAEVKLKNKERLALWIKHHGGPEVDPKTMLFDVQVKRLHEYKRQHLNVFYMLHRYLTIKDMSPEQRRSMVPRLSMVGGKAAPGYATAKTMIKMINCVGDLVNNDPDVSPYFKVFFLPNYNVSSAAVIIPASNINQQISTAGMEASGTSNMKFVMNGSLIIGTMDGANVEIVEEGGDDTAFIFGALEPDVERIRRNARNGDYPIDHRLQRVYNFIRSGALARGDSNAQSQFCGLIDRLLNNGHDANGDYYLVAHDFPSYIDANERVDRLYKDETAWWTTTIKAAANMGKFSTDRTIHEYAQNIWNLTTCEVVGPTQDQVKRLMSNASITGPPTGNENATLNKNSAEKPAAGQPTTTLPTTTEPATQKPKPERETAPGTPMAINAAQKK